jgi:putative Mg2+ transporter-C (MgtC) family protein
MPDLSWAEVLLRIAVAGGLGAAIGLEREWRERAAGLRTHLLVAVGSCVFTLVSAYAWHDFSFGHGVSFDPTRIAAQIVTGIGFLGAGAIIRQGISVRGLTTAATLWVVAGIGMAAGAGYYRGAVLGTAVVLLALWPLRYLGRALSGRTQQARLVVEVREGGSAGPVLSALEEGGAVARSLEFEEEQGKRRIAIDLRLSPDSSPTALVARLSECSEVMGAEWAE